MAVFCKLGQCFHRSVLLFMSEETIHQSAVILNKIPAKLLKLPSAPMSVILQRRINSPEADKFTPEAHKSASLRQSVGYSGEGESKGRLGFYAGRTAQGINLLNNECRENFGNKGLSSPLIHKSLDFRCYCITIILKQ